MTFGAFALPPPGQAGFDVLAGRPQGLRRLMVVSGRLPDGDVGPIHVHQGDEVLRVISGEIVVRCGDERRTCRDGDLVIVPPGVRHGFRVVTETLLEVVAEYDIGTLYPVMVDGSEVELLEVHRPDMPWGRPPGEGQNWTSDEEMRSILGRLAYESLAEISIIRPDRRRIPLRDRLRSLQTVSESALSIRLVACTRTWRVRGPAHLMGVEIRPCHSTSMCSGPAHTEVAGRGDRSTLVERRSERGE